MLHYVVFNNNIKILNILLDAGADPNTEDDRKKTPLYYAARNNYNKSFAILYEKTDEKYKSDPDILRCMKKSNKKSTKIHTELILQSYEFDSTSLFSCDYLCRDLLFLILKKAKNENTLSTSYELVNY